MIIEHGLLASKVESDKKMGEHVKGGAVKARSKILTGLDSTSPIVGALHDLCGAPVDG